MGPTAPSFWRGTIEMQRDRVLCGWNAWQDEHRRHPDRSADPADGFATCLLHDFGPMLADAHFMLVAIRRLEMCCRQMHRVSGNRLILDALDQFAAAVPSAKHVRDVLEHFDAYASCEGRRPETGAQGHWMPRLSFDPDPALNVGDLSVDLLSAADAAVELAETVGAAWRDHISVVFTPAI